MEMEARLLATESGGEHFGLPVKLAGKPVKTRKSVNLMLHP